VIGLLSHLRTCGLADYTEAHVGISASIIHIFGGAVEILPALPVPLHGVDYPALMRALLDFDAWLAAGRQPPGMNLQADPLFGRQFERRAAVHIRKICRC